MYLSLVPTIQEKFIHRSGTKWKPAGLLKWYFIDILKNNQPRATESNLASTALAGVKVHIFCLVLDDDNQ